MLAARVGALEPRLPVADGHPLDQPVLDQQVEHAVDAGAAGRVAAGRSASSISTALSAHDWSASSSMIRSRAPPRLRPARDEHRVDVLAPARVVAIATQD